MPGSSSQMSTTFHTKDASFDAVFISAVLGNLREPVLGLLEAYRVLKPGGVMGVKEFDHGGDLLWPMDRALKRYAELWKRVRSQHRHDQEPGRKIGKYLLDAGFSSVQMTASYVPVTEQAALDRMAQIFAGLMSESWGTRWAREGGRPLRKSETSRTRGRGGRKPRGHSLQELGVRRLPGDERRCRHAARRPAR